VPGPAAGVHYPRTLGEFQAWFRTAADCLHYLEWLRWPDGFVCAACGHEAGWRLGDRRLMCRGCGLRTSPTVGTLSLHRLERSAVDTATEDDAHEATDQRQQGNQEIARSNSSDEVHQPAWKSGHTAA
jgi:hypothetical protein